ncbi:DUF3558 family protein [Nocardia panacis]|nr:DUF3558 family protein [Nocardia panacis]
MTAAPSPTTAAPTTAPSTTTAAPSTTTAPDSTTTQPHPITTTRPNPFPETTRTEPTTTTTTTVVVDPASWDPCAIPSGSIAAAGLDPATKERRSLPNPRAWGCQWLSSDGNYELLIETDDRTVDEIAQSPKVVNVRRIAFFGRRTIVFNARQDGNNIGCLLATETSFGNVLFTARKHADQQPEQEPCDAVQQFAGKLGISLPS